MPRKKKTQSDRPTLTVEELIDRHLGFADTVMAVVDAWLNNVDPHELSGNEIVNLAKLALAERRLCLDLETERIKVDSTGQQVTQLVIQGVLPIEGNDTDP